MLALKEAKPKEIVLGHPNLRSELVVWSTSVAEYEGRCPSSAGPEADATDKT